MKPGEMLNEHLFCSIFGGVHQKRSDKHLPEGDVSNASQHPVVMQATIVR